MDEQKIIEVIALMKSNIGSTKTWAEQLEQALDIEPIIVTNEA
jgi:hypothetical protein